MKSILLAGATVMALTTGAMAATPPSEQMPVAPAPGDAIQMQIHADLSRIYLGIMQLVSMQAAKPPATLQCLYASQAYTVGAVRDGQTCEMKGTGNDVPQWVQAELPDFRAFGDHNK